MHLIAADVPIIAIFNLVGGEVLLVLSVALLLLMARRLPNLRRGIREGVDELEKAVGEVRDEIDNASGGAGRSIGGIYGKHAAEALTTDNQVAELYDPDLLREQEQPGRFITWLRRFMDKMISWLLRVLLRFQYKK